MAVSNNGSPSNGKKLLSEISIDEGARAIFEAFRVNSQYNKIDDDQLHIMIKEAISADVDYMERAGIINGHPYDENEAYVAIALVIKPLFSDKKRRESFIEDYMEAWEIYLRSTGIVDWV